MNASEEHSDHNDDLVARDEDPVGELDAARAEEILGEILVAEIFDDVASRAASEIVLAKYFSGPLPSPDLLEDYERAVPGAVGVIGGSIWLIQDGHEVAGTVLATVDLVALVTVFILGRPTRPDS
jgi:hypothetical protein